MKKFRLKKQGLDHCGYDEGIDGQVMMLHLKDRTQDHYILLSSSNFLERNALLLKEFPRSESDPRIIFHSIFPAVIPGEEKSP